MNWKQKAKGFFGRLLYVFIGAVAATLIISATLSINVDAQKFGYVIDVIKENYVDPEKVKEEGILYERAVNSILEEIGDKHGSYVSPKQYEIMNEEDTPSEYTGIGIEVSWYEQGDVKGMFINEVYDGPAKSAGLKVKDIITKVEGQSYDSLNEYVNKVRGPAGTFVTITVRRVGNELGELTIERDYTTPQNVFSEVLPNNVIYIRIKEFKRATAREMEEHIKERIAEIEANIETPNGIRNGVVNAKPTGLIIDGRYNPGGLLVSAHEVFDLILPIGLKTVTTDGRDNTRMDMEFTAERETLFPEKFPIAIIVNGYCASACEILAGGAKYHEVAKIVGLSTYGKGSVQSIIPLRDGSALKLTTALYYAGGEVKVDGDPIEPDITIGKADKTREEHVDHRLLISSIDLENDEQLKAAWTWIAYANTISPHSRYVNIQGPDL